MHYAMLAAMLHGQYFESMKKSGEVSSQYVQCLGDMSVEGEGSDVLSYTRRWLDQVNRGGPFPLNDSTFTFFAAVEKQVRSRLPQHAIKPSSKEKFKTTVIDGVVQDEDVQFHWSLLRIILKMWKYY